MANRSTSNAAQAHRHSRERLGQMMSQRSPVLLTPGEVAELLRTTPKAIYAMVEARAASWRRADWPSGAHS